MKVQVFGHKGMLGSMVVRAATAAGHTVIGGCESNALIEDVLVQDIVAPVVINCAGVTKQRGCEMPNSEFLSTNAQGPYVLAEACDRQGARLIHVSTDCVFVGKGPHKEDDVPDAQDMYAISKRAGEVIYGPHTTIRTSFVGFGPRGLLADLSGKRSVTVSKNLLWNGHTVDTIANLLVWIAEHPHITRLLHVPGTDQNRYTLARDLKSRWNLPVYLDRNDDFVADRRLASDKWSYLGLPNLPTFEMQLLNMRGPLE